MNRPFPSPGLGWLFAILLLVYGIVLAFTTVWPIDAHSVGAGFVLAGAALLL